MAWDSSRPVPWQRLMREWAIYAVIMSVVLLLFFRDNGAVGAVAGVLVSGPLYLGFGAVMAKFGYQRKSLKELRTPQAAADKPAAEAASGPSERRRPAPTSRTSGGGNQPRKKKRR